MFELYIAITIAVIDVDFMGGFIGYLICKYWKKKYRMRVQTTFNDKLKKHSSHHAFIPDWMHDCVEWDDCNIIIEKVEQKINSV